MSVDTYLKRKDLSRYAPLEHAGLQLHIAPALLEWAQSVEVDAERAMFFWKRFLVEVQHRHRPT